MSSVITPAAFQRADAVADRTVSEQLSDFAVRFDLSQAPREVIDFAKLHVLDCFGIALASTTMEYGQRAVNAARELGGSGDSPVIGMPVRLPIKDAAMVNGTLIHGLDFDDTHPVGVIHCSASAVPTMFAMALSRKKSGTEALAAYLMAIECVTRIAKAARGGLHNAGFHTTAVVGTFGTTLLAGRLADLTAGQLAHAQGLALSMASGTREYHANGAWAKRIHPGLAAANGITAAAWARHGYTGPRSCYEGHYGLYYCAGHGLEVNLDDCTAGLGESWEMLDVAFKPYPACHYNHAFADATLKLRREHNLQPEEVESVTAYIHKDQTSAVCLPEAHKRRPRTPYTAQFSVYYMIAACLVRGRFTLAEIDPEALSDARILDLCDRVNFVTTEETLFPRYFSGTVEIRTKDGRTLRHYQKYNLGSDGNPITADQVKEKFMANATRAVSEPRARRVLNAVMEMETAESLHELEVAVSVGVQETL